MKNCVFFIINFTSKLSIVIFSVILAADIFLFFNGIRLDWLDKLNSFTSYYGGKYRELTKQNSWISKQGAQKSDEDPLVTETVWPNLMRASRANQNKKTKINVAFVNGSYTFGEGVRDQDTMIWRLNDKFPDITFDNYAMQGYGPLQCFQLLKTHILPNKHYDLVCYNINYGNIFVNAYPHAQHGRLNPNELYIMAPYSVQSIFGRWRNYNSFTREWPLQNRLLCLDTAWRFRLGLSGSYDYTQQLTPIYNAVKSFSDKRIDPYKRIAVYNHQIQEIENLCLSYNTDFAVCALETPVLKEVFPRLDIKSPKVDISFADIGLTKNRVLNQARNHPNASVHAYWAEKFSQWLCSEYLLKEHITTP